MKSYKSKEQPTDILHEELASYIKSFPRAHGLKGSNLTYNVVLKDKILVANAVRRGVTVNLFAEIQNNSPFDDKQWSNFLHINLRTLQRFRKDVNYVFKPLQSERIFEMAEVVSKGNEVFDTPKHFNIWLNTPLPAFGFEKPIDMLESSYGKDLVMDELNRIEFGVFV